MFKISPVQDAAVAKEYSRLCGVEYRDDAFLYAATDAESGALLAVSQFEILGEYGYIYSMRSIPVIDDFELMFILGRQTMNFMNSCGAEIIRAGLDSAEHSLLKAIGFNKKEEFFECNTNGMFDGSHCSGHNPVADLT